MKSEAAYDIFFSFAQDRAGWVLPLANVLEARHLRVFYFPDRHLGQVSLGLATELSRIIHRQTSMGIIFPSPEFRKTPITQVEYALLQQNHREHPGFMRALQPSKQWSFTSLADYLEGQLLQRLQCWAEECLKNPTEEGLLRLQHQLEDLPNRIKFRSPILLEVLSKSFSINQPTLAQYYADRARRIV